jgi:hypothetical protein
MTSIMENGKTYHISINKNGDRFWYFGNKLHRESGPAIELMNGGAVYYYDGKKINCSDQKEFNGLVKLAQNSNKEQYFDVKIETMVPAILTFRIYSKSPEEAIQKSKTATPTNVQYKLPAKCDKKVSVYNAGQSIVRLIKNLVG